LIITSHDENCLWRKRGCDGERSILEAAKR
jgi:hypothetical protein